EFVEKATPSEAEAEQALRSIAEIHDLENLAHRPALLDLIVRNRHKLTGDGMTASALYRTATEEWLGTREARHVHFPIRMAFARALARMLFASGSESASFKQVRREVVDVLDDSSGRASLDDAVLEVHTAVFLAFDEAADRLRFAHRSFLEYFLSV